jgi:hypothetical protein
VDQNISTQIKGLWRSRVDEMQTIVLKKLGNGEFVGEVSNC